MARYKAAMWGTLALVASLAAPAEAVVTPTLTGNLLTDDSVSLFDVTLGQTSNIDIFTTSYGGGTNLDGTSTAAGGFVPVLSLFAPDGTFLASDGADITPPGNIDPATGVADDALLSLMGLAPGTYTLAISEFFNFPNGNLSDGFFASGQGNFTGPTCSQPNGSFLQTNLVSCPQRTNAFTINVDVTGVPEPSTYALMIAAFGALGIALRRRRSTSALLAAA